MKRAATKSKATKPTLPARIQKALDADGAIRVIDCRWSKGFVLRAELDDAITSGALRIELRAGFKFAVLA